ncbi:hypothetical protein HY993_02765 [Candidatus Micrarchaeota archaeon]|nr:hypothetical protein [Candidatus Micrarchaeota archaeon]
MKFPKIDLKELRRLKRENFKDRLAFIEFYAQWVKNQPTNEKWSSQQKKLFSKT